MDGQADKRADRRMNGRMEKHHDITRYRYSERRLN